MSVNASSLPAYAATHRDAGSYVGHAVRPARKPASSPYLEALDEESGTYTYTLPASAYRAAQARQPRVIWRPLATVGGTVAVLAVLMPLLVANLTNDSSPRLSRYQQNALFRGVALITGLAPEVVQAEAAPAPQPAAQPPAKAAGDGTRSAQARRKDDYNVQAPPSVSATTIDQVLASYNSPAAGSGALFYDFGLQYGIDPAYALAFYIHESSAGTKGVARFTHSIGNIRTTPGYKDYEGYRSYDSYAAGIEDWYKLIKELYIEGWGLTTPKAIIARYAPWGDNNNPDIYAATVKSLVDSWQEK
ncbi:MAG TPA: glucosaminidase domain-containing protein [Chloroflexia bacterium]|nr:glucosaminidase domain-containing protein [Chloroflexia bacterium]